MGIQYSFRRYEKKYVLSPRQQEQLLQRIAPYMKEDVFGSYTICNIYYDTPDWRLIRASLESPPIKRSSGSAATAFPRRRIGCSWS